MANQWIDSHPNPTRLVPPKLDLSVSQCFTELHYPPQIYQPPFKFIFYLFLVIQCHKQDILRTPLLELHMVSTICTSKQFNGIQWLINQQNLLFTQVVTKIWIHRHTIKLLEQGPQRWQRQTKLMPNKRHTIPAINNNNNCLYLIEWFVFEDTPCVCVIFFQLMCSFSQN